MSGREGAVDGFGTESSQSGRYEVVEGGGGSGCSGIFRLRFRRSFSQSMKVVVYCLLREEGEGEGEMFCSGWGYG